MSSIKRKRPTVLLFDIGGVCVVSPFQAILDYERSKGIPEGYINWTISQTGPTGSWARLERGELVCNQEFYSAWKTDLSNEKRWREYYARHLAQQKGQKLGSGAQGAAYQAPPLPDIDAEWLHNEMMTIARQLDPAMGPALKKLRQHADESQGQLIIGALSNTSIFPPGHMLYDSTSTDGKASRGLENIFDVFVSSAHIGMRKPDAEAYKYAIVRLREYVRTKQYGDGVDAKDITFIDDIGQNLKAAKSLGMNTIKVNLGRNIEAVWQLEKITGLDLTGDNKAKL